MKLIVFVGLCVLLGANAASVGSEGFEEISPFIINGVRSAPAPYIAFIEYFNQQTHGFFGGGALISDRRVLTSATNVHGMNLVNVWLGSNNRTGMTPFAADRANIVEHPAYVHATRANDLAIIRLNIAVVPNAFMMPIALPPATVGIATPMENEEGSFAGFGFQSHGSLGPSQFLYRGFQRVTVGTRCTGFFNVPLATAFCAEDLVERSNGCPGDLGNPFVMSYRRNDVLVGILTQHPPCGQRSPTAYMRITSYRPWINEEMARP